MERTGRATVSGRVGSADGLSLPDAYRRGEREALRLVESWIRTAIGHSRRSLLREPADVVQEVHLRILTNLHRGVFRGDSTFKTYVWAVTRYTSLALASKERRYRPIETHEAQLKAAPETGPEHLLLAAEQRSRLLSAIGTLSGKERRLFQLLYCQGLDYRSAGSELGIPVGTVKSRASRFRTSLTRRVSLPSRRSPVARRERAASGREPSSPRQTGSAR